MGKIECNKVLSHFKMIWETKISIDIVQKCLSKWQGFQQR